MSIIEGSSVVQTLVMVSNPVCFPDFSGDGYLDLVVWSDDDILTEVVVYISRDWELSSLSVSDMHTYGSCNLSGEEVEETSDNFISDLKTKILDLLDKHDVYSSYTNKLNDVIGTYEPTLVL